MKSIRRAIFIIKIWCLLDILYFVPPCFPLDGEVPSTVNISLIIDSLPDDAIQPAAQQIFSEGTESVISDGSFEASGVSSDATVLEKEDLDFTSNEEGSSRQAQGSMEYPLPPVSSVMAEGIAGAEESFEKSVPESLLAEDSQASPETSHAEDSGSHEQLSESLSPELPDRNVPESAEGSEDKVNVSSDNETGVTTPELPSLGVKPDVDLATEPQKEEEVDMRTFDEWKQDKMKQHHGNGQHEGPISTEESAKQSTFSNGIGNTGSEGHGVVSTAQDAGASAAHKTNYALSECGAKVLAQNPEAKASAHILDTDRDKYMNNPCNSRIWFIIELCEPIQIKQFEMANYELFSSTFKDFQLSAADRYPSREWIFLGNFTAKDERGRQVFPISDTMYAKYIKVDIFSHYVKEHFCPLTYLGVYGNTLEVAEQEEEEGEQQKQKQQEAATVGEVLGGTSAPHDLTPEEALSVVQGEGDEISSQSSPTLDPLPSHHQPSSSGEPSESLHNEDKETQPSNNIINTATNAMKNIIRKTAEAISGKSSTPPDCPNDTNLNSTSAIDSEPKPNGLNDTNTSPSAPSTTSGSLPMSLEGLSEGADTPSDAPSLPGRNVQGDPIMFKYEEDEEATETNGQPGLPLASSSIPPSPPQPVLPPTLSSHLCSSHLISTAMLSAAQVDDLATTSPLCHFYRLMGALRPRISLPTDQHSLTDVASDSESSSLNNSITENPGNLSSTQQHNSQLPLEDHIGSEHHLNSDRQQQGTMPQGGHSPSYSNLASTHKENIIIRLKNKVRDLEFNMSLSSQYLEELSRRYRRQMDEMQSKYNQSVTALTATAREAEARDQSQLDRIVALEQQLVDAGEDISSLLNTVEQLNVSVVERHLVLMLIEFLLFTLMIFVCIRPRFNQAISNTATQSEENSVRKLSLPSELPSFTKLNLTQKPPSIVSPYMANGILAKEENTTKDFSNKSICKKGMNKKEYWRRSSVGSDGISTQTSEKGGGRWVHELSPSLLGSSAASGLLNKPQSNHCRKMSSDLNLGKKRKRKKHSPNTVDFESILDLETWKGDYAVNGSVVDRSTGQVGRGFSLSRYLSTHPLTDLEVTNNFPHNCLSKSLTSFDSTRQKENKIKVKNKRSLTGYVINNPSGHF